MKKLTSILAVGILAAFLAPVTSHAQQFKIASVDMNKIFSEYNKTKKAEADLKDKAAAYQKELNTRKGELQKIQEDYNKLREEAENPAFTDDKRAEKRKAMDAKAAEGRYLDGQLREMFTSRGRELDEARTKLRASIVDEILKIVQDKAKKDGYSMVIDKTGLTLSGVSPFLYVQDSLDITPDVIKVLNSSPAAAVAPVAKDPKKLP